MRSKNIELYIEELVLDGLEQDDRQRIAEAVERELTYLFTEKGISPSLAGSSEIDRLDGGTFQAVPGSRPEVIGAKVARAVHGGLKR